MATLAAPGYQASLFTPPDPSLCPEILEEGYSQNNTIALGDDFQSLWWSFTPTRAGLFSADALLSTTITATQPDSLVVQPLVGGFFAIVPGWTAVGVSAEGQRQRQLYLVDETAVGIPIVVGAYGAVLNDDSSISPDPVMITLRIGAITPFELDDWQNGPQHQEQVSGLSDGHYPFEGANAYTINWWATLNTQDGGDDDAFTNYDKAWSLGRRTWQGMWTDASVGDYATDGGFKYNDGTDTAEDRETSTNPLIDPPPGNLWPTPYIVNGQLVGMYSRMATGTRPGDPSHGIGMAECMGGYLTLAFSVRNLLGTLTPDGIGPSLDPDVIRLYDSDSGPITAESPTVRLIKLECVADESTSQDYPNWEPRYINWYMALAEESPDTKWGMHTNPPGTEGTDIGGTFYDSPTVHFSPYGPESMAGGDPVWEQIQANYFGGQRLEWQEVPMEKITAALEYERSIQDDVAGPFYGPGLLFTAASDSSQNSGPFIDADEFDPTHYSGRWQQTLVFRATTAFRYQDVELPELFELVESTIENAFDLARCRFS